MIKLKTFIVGVLFGWALWAYGSIPKFIALNDEKKVNVARMDIKARTSSASAGSGAEIDVTMDWQYVYAGKKQSCDIYSLFDGNYVSSAERNRFESIVASLQRGDTVAGYVSANNPNRCWLVADWSETASLFLFLPFLGVCLCYCLQLIVEKR
jgi:hypothetical protein